MSDRIMNNNNNDNNNRKKKKAPRRSERVLVLPNADCPYDVCPAGKGNCQADEGHTCFGEPRCTNISATTFEQCDEGVVIDGNCTDHFKKNVIAPLKEAAKKDPALKEELENARQKLRNAVAQKRFERVARQKQMALERQQELLEQLGLCAEDFVYKKRIEPLEDYEPKPVPMLSARLSKRARPRRDQEGDVVMGEASNLCPVCHKDIDTALNANCLRCDQCIHIACGDDHQKVCATEPEK